jgi:hypothetical protein
MGGFESYRLVDPEAEAAQSAGRGAAGTGRVQQNSPKSLRKKRKRTPALQSKRFAPTSTVSA